MTSPATRPKAANLIVCHRLLGWLGAFAAAVFLCLAMLAMGGLVRPEGSSGAFLTFCSTMAASLACGTLWHAHRLARLHADLFPEGTATAQLMRAVEEESSRVDLRAEWQSFVDFLRDGLMGRGWTIPTEVVPGCATADPAMLRDRVARAIREARGEQKQEALAAEAGISVRTWRRAETEGRASVQTLRAICRVLGIEVPATDAEVETQCRPRAWARCGEGLFGVAMFFLLSAGFCLGVIQVSRKVRIWTGATVLAVAASIVVGVRVWHADMLWDPMTARHYWDLADLADAVSIAIVGGHGAGLLCGMAWRSTSARFATVAACTAVVVFASANAPLWQMAVSVSLRSTVAVVHMQTYGAVVQEIKDRAATDPGYDAEKAIAMRATPFIYQAMGVPAPEWTKDEAAYLRWRAEKDMLRR